LRTTVLINPTVLLWGSVVTEEGLEPPTRGL
jgi:hypothetical protein